MIISTFNMKNSYFPSASNNWIKRADATIEFIKKRNVDLIGAQELTSRTKSYLEKALDDYIFVGESRGSLGISDEYNSILLKRSVFELLKTETYSLSNNIYKKGSKFFLDIFPRICTTAHVMHDKDSYLIINTHLDNLFSINRKLQLEVLSEIIELEKKEEENIIILGDFNMQLKGVLKNFEKENNLVDTISNKLGSSYKNFGMKEPIDHIFVSKDGFNLIDAEFDKQKYNNVSPSDHYPVVVKINRKK